MTKSVFFFKSTEWNQSDNLIWINIKSYPPKNSIKELGNIDKTTQEF